MRSRPIVRVLLGRSPLEPGSTIDADVVLVSRSETPVEFAEVTMRTEVFASIPAGKTTASRRLEPVPPQHVRWSPGTLAKGEHRRRVRFTLPEDTPPSYRAARGWCRVSYLVEVHVAIPYWIDRRTTFALPVAAPPRLPAGGAPALVATHARGQTAGELYVEASLETTELVPGEELRGDVSFANVKAQRIRRVEVGFVLSEDIHEPVPARNVVTRFTATLGSGPPPEGETIPFRIKVPADAWPSFHARLFALEWRFEVRVDVVLGSDVVLAVPIRVVRPVPGATLPERAHRALPVGKQRLARLWALVAQRVGVAFDEVEGTMMASRGAVTMTLAREVFQGTLGTVAHYHYPHLGLDVRLAERGILDAVARGRYDLRHMAARKRFAVTGREPAQLDAFFDEKLSRRLVSATRVELDDDGALVHVEGTASSAAKLETVARSALRLLDLLDEAIARIPVPAAMTMFEDAWREFAASVGGRFEPGRVFVHDASLGGFRFEVGTVWEPDRDAPMGTVVRVPIDPPLERPPDVEDASLSASARETLRKLAETPGFRAAENEIGVFTHDLVEDPKRLQPTIEAMVAVLRALRGVVAAGPFR